MGSLMFYFENNWWRIGQGASPSGFEILQRLFPGRGNRCLSFQAVMSLAQTIQTRHKCTAQIANQVLQTYIAHAGDRPPAPVNMVKPLAPVEPPKPKPLVYTFGESDASWEKRSDEYKTQYSLAATKALDVQSKYVEALRLYEADLAAEEKYKAWVTGLEAETPELVKAAKAAQAAKQRPKPVPLADKRKRQAVDDDDDDGGSVAVVGSGRASSRKKTKALSKRKQNEAVSPETLSSDEVWEPRVQRAIGELEFSSTNVANSERYILQSLSCLRRR